MTDNMSIIFSLIGTTIGGLIGYNTAIRVSDRKEFQKVSIEFQDAFFNILLQLDSRYSCMDKDGRDAYQIIMDNFPQQMKAMLRFRLYLPAENREAFDKAWNEYCHYEAKPGQPTYGPPFLEQYHGTDGKLALERIHNLLKFSEIAHKSPFERQTESA